MDAETMERIRLQAQQAIADARAYRALLAESQTPMDDAALQMERRLEREHRRALRALDGPT